MATAVFFLLATKMFAAAPTGPTLHFDYGHGELRDNPVSKFMYFVPLISPEPVSVFTNAGNPQYTRVLSFSSRTNGATFSVTCEFDFTGTGSLQNVFDHTPKIQMHEKELRAGTPLKHQLDSINVLGNGSGSIEIDGAFTNGQRVINLVELRFNRHGHTSPVTINLEDIVYRNGAVRSENEMVARVNALIFRRVAGTPKMEVSLASLKSKAAGDGLWQNFMGSLKGATANLFLPPLKIEPEGQQAMLDFGLALATEKSDFTFPIATRLKVSAPAKL
ncbi:MAG TPA: hypothetical protein VIK62_07765 [Verrucomicrobiae bacterium]